MGFFDSVGKSISNALPNELKKVSPSTWAFDKLFGGGGDKKKSSSSSSGGGGGEGGSSGGSQTSGAESTEAQMRALLKASPYFAKEQMDQLNKYAPEQAQLAIDMYKEFTPKDLEARLDVLRKYNPEFAEMSRLQNDAQRQGEFESVRNLAPQLQGLREAGERGDVTDMRNMLFGQVQEDLAAGDQLTGKQTRTVEQGMRASQTARGLGLGQGSANRESVAKFLAGEAMKRERQQAAQSLITMESQQAPDPFLSILNRPSSNQAYANAQTAGTNQQPNLQTQNGVISGLAGAGTAAQLGQNQQNIDLGWANFGLGEQQYNMALDIAKSQYGATLGKY